MQSKSPKRDNTDLPLTEKEVTRRIFQAKILQRYAQDAEIASSISKSPKKKVSIYFRNNANDPSPNMKPGEFTLIKCPSFKKCVKLHEIRLRNSHLRNSHNFSKSTLTDKE